MTETTTNSKKGLQYVAPYITLYVKRNGPVSPYIAKTLKREYMAKQPQI